MLGKKTEQRHLLSKGREGKKTLSQARPKSIKQLLLKGKPTTVRHKGVERAEALGCLTDQPFLAFEYTVGGFSSSALARLSNSVHTVF